MPVAAGQKGLWSHDRWFGVVCRDIGRGWSAEGVTVGDAVHELLVTDVGLAKLGARQISAEEAAQVLAIAMRLSATRPPGRARVAAGC